MLVRLLTLFLVWFMVVGIHEAGHVIAGRLAGLHYWWLQVGPVLISRTRSGATVRLQRLSLAWGGMCACFQPGLDCDRAVSVYRAVCAGGPLLNLLTGIAAGLVFGPGHPFALLSIAIGIITLLPLPGPRPATDGSRVLVLLRGGNAAREHAAMLGVASAISLSMDRQAMLPLLEVLTTADKPQYREAAARIDRHLRSA